MVNFYIFTLYFIVIHNLRIHSSTRWVTTTKPTDTAYDWYLLSCASDNSIWVLHTSMTGVYLFHNATRSVSCDTGYYWLGVRK